MLKHETVKLFNGSDVFDACQKKFGCDIEGDFNEIYCPPAEGAIFFWIPDTNEEWDEREECEKYVAGVLMDEGGLTYGEGCYIRFDY